MFGSRYFGPRYFGGRFFGHAGLTVSGRYNGSRYFSNRYFGPRHFGSDVSGINFDLAQTAGVSITGTIQTGGSSFTFGSDFEVTQVTGITLSGTLLVNGPIQFGNDDWAFTPPLEVSTLIGALTVAGNITIGAPAPGYGSYWGRRHFGGRYFGPRYFGAPESWNVEQTTGISLSGALNVAGGFTTALDLSPTAAVALTGEFLTTADVLIDGARQPNLGGPNRGLSVSAGKKRRNYIIKGQKYYDLTTEELAVVVAQVTAKRKDVKVEIADQKPKTVDSATWQEVKPFDDDEDILLLL